MKFARKCISIINDRRKILGLLLVLFPSLLYAQNAKRQIDSLFKIVDTAKGLNRVKIIERLNFLTDKLKNGELDSCIKQENTAKEDTNKINLFRLIGRDYDQIRSVSAEEKAIEYFTKELQLSQKLHYYVGIFRACGSIGDIYYRTCNYPQAEKYYLMQLSAAQKNKSELGIGLCYSSIGNIYQVQKNYPEAVKYYDAYLQIMLKYNFTEQIVYAYRNLGELCETQGNFTPALKYFSLALNISKKLWWSAHYGDGFVLSDIGDIYRLKGNYNKARKFYFLVFKVEKENGLIELSATAYLKLGMLEISVKNYSNAAKYLNKGVLLAQKVGTKDIMDECYHELVTLYTDKNDYVNALKYTNLYMSIEDSVLSTESNLQIAQMQMQYDFNEKQAEQTSEQDKKDAIQKAELDKKNAVMEITIKRQHLLYFVFSLILVLLLLIGLLVYNRFKLKNRLEKQLAVSDERKRISTEMHDDLGSGLSKISLLSEVVKEDITNQNSKGHLENISKSSKELVDKMGEIVWALNSNYDKIENLLIYIRKYAIEYFESTNIQCEVNMPEYIPDIAVDGDKRRNIFLTVKESLHNVLKHSLCSFVTITITIDSNKFKIFIHDNGKGINLASTSESGNGLTNMRTRIEDIKGSFAIKNHYGTTVELNIPLAI